MGGVLWRRDLGRLRSGLGLVECSCGLGNFLLGLASPSAIWGFWVRPEGGVGFFSPLWKLPGAFWFGHPRRLLMGPVVLGPGTSPVASRRFLGLPRALSGGISRERSLDARRRFFGLPFQKLWEKCDRFLAPTTIQNV